MALLGVANQWIRAIPYPTLLATLCWEIRNPGRARRTAHEPEVDDITNYTLVLLGGLCRLIPRPCGPVDSQARSLASSSVPDVCCHRQHTSGVPNVPNRLNKMNTGHFRPQSYSHRSQAALLPSPCRDCHSAANISGAASKICLCSLTQK